MQKIKKGDEVIVIAGKDKGRRGKVVRIDEGRVVVENVNVAQKHQRPSGQPGSPNAKVGGIVKREMPLSISNVLIYNPATKKGDRVGVRELKDGRRVRFFKSNKEQVDV
ncbi:MAG TPA: 50S ribosomal protein L24 [Steroidobacteraceae bacterium]|nr:50S ribosomal protein L24 [Steroidobacteraceae bacterium]